MGIYYGSTLAYNEANPPATGGTVTTITQNGIKYRVHTFTTVGTSTLTVTRPLSKVEYLIVAGGGGGGGSSAAPGGTGGSGIVIIRYPIGIA